MRTHFKFYHGSLKVLSQINAFGNLKITKGYKNKKLNKLIIM